MLILQSNSRITFDAVFSSQYRESVLMSITLWLSIGPPCPPTHPSTQVWMHACDCVNHYNWSDTLPHILPLALY